MGRLSDFIAAIEREVANHSIYVWGGSGQLCKSVNEAWIRSKESRCQSGKYADMAVAEWRTVMNSPYKNVARCFDCSGYVSYCLMTAHALDKRRDCDGLYDRCKRIEKPENGCLLFRVNDSNPNDETHVGVYYNGYQYHAKGRAYGVVKEKYNASYWAKISWFKALPHEGPSPEPQPEPQYAYEIKVHGSVNVRKENGVLHKKIATVRNCRLPYLGQATESPYWYKTIVDGQEGYITSKPKYTEIVEVEL